MKRKKLGMISVLLAVVLTSGAMAAAASGDNTKPIAENLELTTYREVSLEGKLSAKDPEGGELTYTITTPPNKGKLELNEDGSFVYTPEHGKKGKDYFGYKAIDPEGNSSSEATVIIKIEKQKSAVHYTDLEGSGAEYAAVLLAEKELFVGERLGGEYVFDPDRPVSRGEFLTMCMELADYDILSGVINTGFADDDEIPAYQKPYVSTAILTGVVSGYPQGAGSAVFSGSTEISCTEASVILNRSLGLTDVSLEGYGDEAPLWAAQACANISACRITDYAAGSAKEPLTRAQCAKMLVNAMNVLENR